MSTRLDTEQFVPQPNQTRAAKSPRSAVSERVDQTTWDRELAAQGGHLMQSWRWGEFKRRDEWRVERLRVSTPSGVGMAQILIRPYGPMATAFVPRGPVISGDQEAVLPELLAKIDDTCRRHRVLWLGIESRDTLPFSESPDRFGFVKCQTRYSPGRTVSVTLVDDNSLLKQMNSTTRYHVRRAQRDGVEVRAVAPDEHGIATFHRLLQETAARHDFPINSPAHYRDVLQIFGNDATLLIASVDGADVAGVVATRFGDEAIYLFGASATRQPVQGSPALVQFEAMRWARSVGCSRYDLWGIDRLQARTEEGSLDRSTERECPPGNGLCRYKIGFGGEIVVLPWRIERQYHPHLVRVLRRTYDIGTLLRR